MLFLLLTSRPLREFDCFFFVAWRTNLKLSSYGLLSVWIMLFVFKLKLFASEVLVLPGTEWRAPSIFKLRCSRSAELEFYLCFFESNCGSLYRCCCRLSMLFEMKQFCLSSWSCDSGIEPIDLLWLFRTLSFIYASFSLFSLMYVWLFVWCCAKNMLWDCEFCDPKARCFRLCDWEL